jgi:hypothetical protein
MRPGPLLAMAATVPLLLFMAVAHSVWLPIGAARAAAPLPADTRAPAPRRALLQRKAPATTDTAGLCPCGVMDNFPQGVICRVCAAPQDPTLTLKPGDAVPCRCGVASSVPAGGGVFKVVCRVCGPNDALDFTKPLPILAPNGSAVFATVAGKPAAAGAAGPGPAQPLSTGAPQAAAVLARTPLVAARAANGGAAGLTPQPRAVPPIAAPAAPLTPPAIGAVAAQPVAQVRPVSTLSAPQGH